MANVVPLEVLTLPEQPAPASDSEAAASILALPLQSAVPAGPLIAELPAPEPHLHVPLLKQPMPQSSLRRRACELPGAFHAAKNSMPPVPLPVPAAVCPRQEMAPAQADQIRTVTFAEGTMLKQRKVSATEA